MSKFGFVIGNAMQKTVKVQVEKQKIHPVVGKLIRFHKNFLVHDPNEEAVLGDFVRIDPSRKFSKHKHFVLGAIVKPAHRVEADGKLITQAQENVTLKQPRTSDL